MVHWVPPSPAFNELIRTSTDRLGIIHIDRHSLNDKCIPSRNSSTSRSFHDHRIVSLGIICVINHTSKVLIHSKFLAILDSRGQPWRAHNLSTFLTVKTIQVE